MLSLETPVSGSKPRTGSQCFPKSARLRKSRDFQFRPYKRYHSEYFHFLYTSKGSGRLGISISRKVLKRATARNRVRRLLKEAFRRRLEALEHFDVHVIGQPALKDRFGELGLSDVERQFDEFISQTTLKSR